MTKSKLFTILSLLFNSAIVIIEIVALVTSFVKVPENDELAFNGIKLFIPFTNQSNIFLLFASSLFVVFDILALSKQTTIPFWAYIIKFSATCSVSLTFLTVCFYLGPVFGFAMVFGGMNLYFHLICPVLSLIVFIIFESRVKIKWSFSFFGIIPTVCYAMMYIPLTLCGLWLDLYGFFLNLGPFFWLPMMFIGSYAIALLVWFLSQLSYKKIIKHI